MAIALKKINSNLKELTSEIETLRCELAYLKSKLRDVYEGKALL